MATWSAPGKVFLFGEHAVVYGKPGVAMAIRPRVFVTVRKSKSAHHARSPYIDSCFDEMGVKGSVYVNSQLPSSSGLGSSAAVTVATLSAINDEFGKKYSMEEIATMAYAIEKKVQKGKASPTDTSVSTFGGIVMITGTQRRRLPPQNLPLVVGNTLVSHSTAKMVEKVADLKKKNPEICEPILDAIGAVSMCAIRNFSDPHALGNLMNMNHALLEALGAGHPTLSRLVLAARAAGAYGAKLTGAGGGGCMVAICPKHLKSRVVGAVEACDAKAFITNLDTEGARKEKDV
ncbi:MAG TPA: mevalonate kinase [Methanolinea sp.]|nr:MAG: Mevalonate kinase [Methanoregulaceae archaeon PtaB.Bin009]OPY41382.1 MAG: Mevalonate kinase [Methanoregulaceae archaeon PtaU1.Bin066]HII76675.1 mevalonate kinase [Methanolinea sp.]HNQ30364.1 mevalonate kinase [Methanolinea sp.]